MRRPLNSKPAPLQVLAALALALATPLGAGAQDIDEQGAALETEGGLLEREAAAKPVTEDPDAALLAKAK